MVETSDDADSLNIQISTATGVRVTPSLLYRNGATQYDYDYDYNYNYNYNYNYHDYFARTA